MKKREFIKNTLQTAVLSLMLVSNSGFAAPFFRSSSPGDRVRDVNGINNGLAGTVIKVFRDGSVSVTFDGEVGTRREYSENLARAISQKCIEKRDGRICIGDRVKDERFYIFETEIRYGTIRELFSDGTARIAYEGRDGSSRFSSPIKYLSSAPAVHKKSGHTLNDQAGGESMNDSDTGHSPSAASAR